MNLGTIRTRCKDRWRDPTNAILDDAAWTAYINDAYSEVLAASAFWPFAQSSSSSVSVAIGVRSATLPTNVFGVTAVYNITDQAALQPVEGSDRPYRSWPDQTEQGLPVSYRVRAGTLEVYPLPDHAVTLKIEFQTYPAELSADADLPPWPAQFHRILVLGAFQRAYEDDAAPQTAAAYQAEFAAQLELLKEYVFSGSASRYPGVVDTFYD